jgi:FG-GAP-like repeat/RTX calcium-binding nonapeptide repeat (4 copies)
MFIRLDAFDDTTKFWINNGLTVVYAESELARYLINVLPAASTSLTFSSSGGNDTVIFDGSYSYQANTLSFFLGDGDDRLNLGVGFYYSVGSVNVDAGGGNDQINIGTLQGNIGTNAGNFHAGDGNDVISIHANEGDFGIFGNSVFQFFGDSGDDEFVLEGTQLATATSCYAVLNGGSGFDTLHWNARYNLAPLVGLQSDAAGFYYNTPILQGVLASNLERIIVTPSDDNTTVYFSANAVKTITDGSDFNRALIGSNWTGSGDVLFLDYGDRPVSFNLAGWTSVGIYTNGSGATYAIYEDDTGTGQSELLLISTQFSSPITYPTETFAIDAINGGNIRLSVLFASFDPSWTFSLLDSNGAVVSGAAIDLSRSTIDVAGGLSQALTVVVSAEDSSGATSTRTLVFQPSSLSFANTPTNSDLTSIGVGDLNGDGLLDTGNSWQNSDGTFTTVSLTSMGLDLIYDAGRFNKWTSVADIDSDGDLDLLAVPYDQTHTGQGQNRALLYLNDGTGHFTESASFSALDIRGFGETAVYADFNNDGQTDIFMPFYFRNDSDGSTPAGSRLLINHGNLGFTDETSIWDITNSTATLSLGGFGQPFDQNFMPEAAQAFDWNHDGLIDLYVGGHFFLNQGGAFTDVSRALGLPTVFDEGATFFDFNNDGHLDFVVLQANIGPSLYVFDTTEQRFKVTDVFPGGRIYDEAVGISVADVNGDGWTDLLVAENNSTTIIYLNNGGSNFIEYVSGSTEGLYHYGSIGLADINGDGLIDIPVGGTNGVFINTSSTPAHAVNISVLGQNGERNQYGRTVTLTPTNSADHRIFTQIVDGGSGELSQRNYELIFTDNIAQTYTASCYLVDAVTGHPVLVSFTAVSGHDYEVRAGSSVNPVDVIDLTANTVLSFDLTYPNAVVTVNVDDNTPTEDLPLTASVSVDMLMSNGAIITNFEWQSCTSGSWQNIGFGANYTPTQTDVGSAIRVVVSYIETSGGTVKTAVSEITSSVADSNIYNIINGTISDDTLYSTNGPDIFYGLAGNDVFVVGTDDIVFEASGAGEDRIVSSVDYTLSSNVELLILTGSDAVTATGNNQDNSLYGLYNSSGNELVGLGGNDVYFVGTGDTVVEAASSGEDRIVATIDFTLSLNVELLILTGADAVTATGNNQGNLIYGLYNSSSNILIGLGGDDIYFVGAGDTVVEAAGDGEDRVVSTIDYTLSSNVELLILTGSANVKATGSSQDNSLYGLYNSGANLLAGLGGDDVYFVGTGDTVIEDVNNGEDRVVSAIDYTISNNVELLILTGDADVTATGNNQNNSLYGLYNSGANSLVGLGGDDVYIVGIGDTVVEAAGGGEDRVITTFDYALSQNVELIILTGAAEVTATGNNQNNSLYGLYNSGANELIGLGGDDVYFVGLGDSVNEAAGGGEDRVVSTIDFTLSNNVELLILTGAATVSATGNNQNNNLYGLYNPSANILTGLGGDDVYVIGAGDTVIEDVSGGNDRVVSTIDYTLTANVEGLYGSGSNDLHLVGNNLRNTIQGNSGNDTLTGGFESDTLSGNAGSDSFNYSSISDFGLGGIRENITDFQTGSDTLNFSEIDSNINLDGNQDFSFIGSNAFTATGQASAGELRVYAVGGALIVEGDIDGNGIADFQLQLDHATILLEQDLIL